jgi:hypothetical protein
LLNWVRAYTLNRFDGYRDCSVRLVPNGYFIFHKLLSRSCYTPDLFKIYPKIPAFQTKTAPGTLWKLRKTSLATWRKSRTRPP